MIRKHRLSARVAMPLVIAVAGMTAMAGSAIAQAGGPSASGPVPGYPSIAAIAKAAPAAPQIAAGPQAGVAPAAAAADSNNALFFYRGTDTSMYVGGLAPTEAPFSLGGHFVGGPGVVFDPATGYQIFGRGADNALWAFTGAPWTSFGGNLTSKPAVAACSLNGTDTIAVFVRGTDGGLWYKLFKGSTVSAWTSLDGHVAPNSDPAAVCVGNTLYAFVVGTDGAAWVTSTTDGTHWTGYTSLGGHVSGLSAAAPSATAGVLFARGTDNAVWYNPFVGGTAGWKSLGGHITSGTGAASAVLDASGTTWVLALGSDNRIWGRTGVWPALAAWAKVF